MLLSNVTRFGKCFNRLWQFVAGLFSIWLNFEATFDNVLFYSQISKSNPVNWPNCFCMTRQRSRIYVSSHRLGQQSEISPRKSFLSSAEGRPRNSLSSCYCSYFTNKCTLFYVCYFSRNVPKWCVKASSFWMHDFSGNNLLCNHHCTNL